MSQHSVLVIGCGSIGERHLRCFQQTGRAAVTACDSNPALLQRMADTYKVPTLSNWETALNDPAIGIVVICTPANLHVAMALKALAAGKHVLIEKPLSQSLAGVDQLLEARDRRKLKAAVAYVYHTFPYLVAAKEFLSQGSLGEVKEALCFTGQPFHTLRPAYANTYYKDRKTGGGAIQDALTHVANWMESVLGPTESVLCDCDHQVLAGVEVEDTVHIASRHKGALVCYCLNQFQAPNEMTLQFNTREGSVKIETHHQRWGVLRQGEKDWTWHVTPLPARDAAFIAQATNFLDYVEGKTALTCSIEAAIQTLRFNLAALESAKSGSRVRCRDVAG